MRYEGIANSVYREMGVPLGLQRVFKAQIQTESAWIPNNPSSAKANGLTQFIPSTAARYGVQYGNSEAAVRSQIRGQVLYMNTLIKRYHGDVTKAAMAYNMGEGGMDKVLQGKRSLPTETRNYPITIQRNLKYYK